MLLKKCFTDALTGIVPRRTGVIVAVDKNDREISRRGDVPHVVGETTMEFVADEGIVLFIVTGTQNDLIKALHARQREDRIVQSPIAVVATKKKRERKLARSRQARALVIATVNAESALDLEAGIILGQNPFDGNGALPRDAVFGRIMIIARGG